MTLIAHGATTKEIAAKLGVSFSTVDTHRTNLMRKLKIRNVAGLVVYAFRAALIEVSQDLIEGEQPCAKRSMAAPKQRTPAE